MNCLLDMLLAINGPSSSIFVIIDALDECPLETRADVLSALMSIKSSIHLLITSRNIGYIPPELGEVTVMEVNPPKEDLKSYAEGCIKQNSILYKNFCALTEEIREEHLSFVALVAKGM